MKKSGFTLAEVLITLVIIGVIAALTLGTVVSNTSKKQLESQTQKFYAQFSKAVELYMADNNIEKFGENDSISQSELFFNYLKVIKKCNDWEDGCFAKEYILTPEEPPAVDVLYGEQYMLQDGSSVQLYGEIPGYVAFDVNGPKKPNKASQDLWSFYIHTDGSLDGWHETPELKKASTASEINDLVKQNYEAYCHENQYGSCFAYFIRNGFKIVD